MLNRSIEFAGHDFRLHPSGALFWPAESMLVVGDLHLEKASSYHRSGQFLPPYDTAQTLQKLASVMADFRPKRLLFLGDVFHDGDAWQRMAVADRDRLERLISGCETIWVEGNHDAHFTPPGHIGQLEAQIGGIAFRHIMENAGTVPEISAHFHPAAKITHRGTRLRRPCFVCAQDRMILPAFGALTGGLDVGDAAFSVLRGRATRLYLLGSKGVFAAPAGLPIR